MEGVITNGPCARCRNDHGRTPKHWRNDATGELFLFCGGDCRQVFIGEATRPGRLTVKGSDRLKKLRDSIPGMMADAMEKAVQKTQKKLQKQIREKLLTPTEAEISKAIGDRLDDLGIWNTRINSGLIKTDSGRVIKLAKEGTPDRVFACGLTVWLEIKRLGKAPTPAQVKAHSELSENGSLALVLDRVEDLEIVLQTLVDNKAKTALIRKLQSEIRSDLFERLGR